MFKNLTKKERAWVLYDVGNSAFTMLACSLIPIFFKALAIGDAPGQITGDQATAYYSIAISVVTVVVAILGPICGVLADHKGRKKILFRTCVALGVIGCILNGFTTSWTIFIVLFVLTRIFYFLSLTFYDSMLNDITTEERMDEVSSYGYAGGYIGSCIPFIIAMVAYILGGGLSESLMLFSPRTARIIGFMVTGFWWLAVTIPLLREYKQINYVKAEKGEIADIFRKIGGTLRKIADGVREAMNEAMRYWVSHATDTYYVIGTAAGPDPYPEMVRDFQRVIGDEARAQILEKTGRLPDLVVACVGGGSNAIGAFYPFLDDPGVALLGAEAGGEGVETGRHAASICGRQKGILHGAKTYLLQNADGQVHEAWSISAGLDYPGVGPEHALLADIGRARYVAITDAEAVRAFHLLCRLEGIIPALESSHALAAALKAAKDMRPDQQIVVCLSGRGDKDIDHVNAWTAAHGGDATA